MASRNEETLKRMSSNPLVLQPGLTQETEYIGNQLDS